MPVAARQLVRSASAADVRVHEKTKREKQLHRVLMLQSDVDYLRSALEFSETQHFMLRLPIWKDLVREVNETVGCGCAACRWNGLVAVDGEQECGPALDSLDIVQSTECALQLKLLKTSEAPLSPYQCLRVSVHVADRPQRVSGVDAGLTLARFVQHARTRFAETRAWSCRTKPAPRASLMQQAFAVVIKWVGPASDKLCRCSSSGKWTKWTAWTA